MSQDIDNVMQAAERMRRLDAGDDSQIVDRAFSAVKDRYTLADFALSILPKGKRPVPITEFPLNVGIVPVWSIRTGLQQLFLRSGELYPYQSLAERGEPKDWMSHRPVYTNRGDAVLAMNWQKFDELHRAALAS